MAATSRPDDQDLPSPRQITARTSGRSRSSARIVEQLGVHVVVEGVVLVGVVVGDRGDGTLDLEPHLIGHVGSPISSGVSSSTVRAPTSAIVRRMSASSRPSTWSTPRSPPAPRP